MQTTPKIGAHVSVAGGLYKAVENAQNIGAECFQIFGANPRQWQVCFPGENEIAKFKNANTKNMPIFLHAPYLINLASAKSENYKKSIKCAVEHYNIAEALGAEGLVIHLGSGEKDKLIKGIKKVLSLTKGKATLFLENSSGGGNKLGSSFKEVDEILKALNSSRVKICFDTAHCFASGDNLSSWDFKNVGVLHINDSKTVFNSKNDRHENIGKGYLGIDFFKNLAKSKVVNHLPWILEVPGFDNNGPDKKNIDILRGLF